MSKSATISLIFAATCFIARGQGPPGPPPGMVGKQGISLSSASSCSTRDGASCSQDGSSNYYENTSLVYDSKTGTFSGNITMNMCSQNSYGICETCTGSYNIHSHTADCSTQQFPDANFLSLPDQAPLRGAAGYSLYGVNIYGPMEAGFRDGFVCDGGECDSGVDVPACDAQLRYQCGDSGAYELLLDTCGGHAMPYHYHKDLTCDYDHSGEGHSPLIGIALDGRGIYGLFEGDGEAPTDLDACGGHFGKVPVNTAYGVKMTEVYHYHTSEAAPYTLGCYGPVESVDECKSLYETCNTGYVVTYGEEIPNGQCYDTDCPCYNADGSNTEYSVVNCPSS